MRKAWLVEVDRVGSGSQSDWGAQQLERQAQQGAEWGAIPGKVSGYTATEIERFNGTGSVGALHAEALSRIAERLANTAQGGDTAAIHAIPMPTGGGKTALTSSFAAAAALNQSKRIAVLCTTTRDLYELFNRTARKLFGAELGDGPLDPSARQHQLVARLGLIHHDNTFDPFHQPTPLEQLEQCSVVFATQQKAIGPRGEEALAGMDLYVLDEDNGHWSTRYVTVEDVRGACEICRSAIVNGFLDRQVKGADLHPLGEYLAACSEAVQRAVGTGSGELVRLPPVDQFGNDKSRPDRVVDQLRTALGNRYPDIKGTIAQLVAWNGCAVDVRNPVDVHSAIYPGCRRAVLSFKFSLPPWMRPIVQLDAQAGHNGFLSLSKAVQVDSWFVDNYARLKSYEGSKIHHLAISNSRETVEREFAKPSQSRLINTLIQTLKDHIPSDEAVLIACLKNRVDRAKRSRVINPDHYIDVIRTQMTKHGLDPDERLSDGSRRFMFGTHGKLKATNEFKKARHVYFIGVLRRPPESLMASAVAAKGEGGVHHPDIDIRELLKSELASEITQASNRICMREIWGSTAKPGTIWLPMANEQGMAQKVLDELTQRQMPGLQAEPWPGVEINAVVPKWKLIANATDEVLASFQEDTITLVELRRLVGERVGQELTVHRFSQVIAKSGLPDGWQKKGPQWVRS